MTSLRINSRFFEDEAFKSESFNEALAWLWLLSSAAKKDTFHVVQGQQKKVRTGELFTSFRTLQRAWNWSSPSRTKRFILKLEKHEKIKIIAEHPKTHISICNYSSYFDSYNFNGTVAEHQTEQRAEHQTDLLSDCNQTDNSDSYNFNGTPNGTPSGTLNNIYKNNINNNKLLSILQKGSEEPQAKSQKIRLPEDWRPLEENAVYARKFGIAEGRVEHEKKRFKNHWLGNTTQAARKKNWELAFSNWLKKSAGGYSNRYSSRAEKYTAPKAAGIVGAVETVLGQIEAARAETSASTKRVRGDRDIELDRSLANPSPCRGVGKNDRCTDDSD